MLEIIAQTLKDAVTIEKNGGERIELISSLSEGGLTPSYGLVKQVICSVTIPVNVMLRPHSTSFQYSREDIEIMKEDARMFNELGVKHVVLGILDYQGLPSMDDISYILEDTNLTATFHRAIDESSDLNTSLKLLTSNKRITHVLTSGGPGKAEENLPKIKELLKESEDLTIIIASGITAANINAIQNELDFIFENEDSRKDYDIHIGTGVRSGNQDLPVSAEEVRQMVALYKNHRVVI